MTSELPSQWHVIEPFIDISMGLIVDSGHSGEELHVRRFSEVEKLLSAVTPEELQNDSVIVLDQRSVATPEAIVENAQKLDTLNLPAGKILLYISRDLIAQLPSQLERKYTIIDHLPNNEMEEIKQMLRSTSNRS